MSEETDPKECKIMLSSAYSPGEWEMVEACDIAEVSEQSTHVTKIVMKDGRVILTSDTQDYIYESKRNCGCP